MNIYQSEEIPSTTFQLIPSKFLDNKSVNHLADSFHKIYKKPTKRIEINPDDWRINHESQNDLFWEVLLSKENIKFFLTAPKKTGGYIKNQIENSWPKVTIKKNRI